jgi:hypothetical protein
VKEEAPADSAGADAGAVAAPLLAMTRRAQAAEARCAALEHGARGDALGKRSAEARADALHHIVGVKRERLEHATAAAACAQADATRAADALDDATTCRVCFSEPRQMLFLPYCHLAVCAACSAGLRALASQALPVAARSRGAPAAKPACPVCRTEADSIVGPIFHP